MTISVGGDTLCATVASTGCCISYIDARTSFFEYLLRRGREHQPRAADSEHGGDERIREQGSAASAKMAPYRARDEKCHDQRVDCGHERSSAHHAGISRRDRFKAISHSGSRGGWCRC